MPFSYDVANIEQLDEVTTLMRDDFTRAGHRFLDPINSLPELREHLVADSAAGARMYAIAVTYLMNGRMTFGEVDTALGLQANAMSREFAEYFKKKFASAHA
jgi:hypothetical protein